MSQKCGIDNFIDNDDSTVAFSGTKSNMELLLEIITQKYDGQNYLYASVDDEVSWHEWDFDNIDEFIRNISEYISNRVNRTIKTVTTVCHRFNFFLYSLYFIMKDIKIYKYSISRPPKRAASIYL